MIFKRVILIFFMGTKIIWGQSQNCKDVLQKCIIENGKSLLNIPYESGTLDRNTIEKLTYWNDKFDCVTFVEYVFALSILHSQKVDANQTFEEILTKIRYKGGIIDGYGSRLHYFTSWIIQNCNNGNLTDITRNLGGIPWQKRIHFMSSNQRKYPQLIHKSEIKKILEIENSLSKANIFYIPKEKVKSIINKIENGDIIAITTNIKGLDIVHTGIAIIQNEGVHLMHASADEKKVVISKDTLDKYLKDKRTHTGIMVLRSKCVLDEEEK